MRNYAKHLGLTLLALACSGYFVTPAPAQQSTTAPDQAAQGAADQAGGAMNRAADQAGQAAGSAAGQAGGAMSRAGETMQGETGMAGSRLAVTLPPGVTEKRARGTEGIHDVFKTAAQSIVAGNYDKFRDQLAAADRDRLGRAFDDLARTQLQGTVDQIRNTWKSKYNTNFDIDRANRVYAAPFSYVTQGEISDPALVTNWPLPATAQMASQPTPPENASRAGKIDRGRDVAVVVLPPLRGSEQELTVSMIHQAPDFWKVDIPDNIDAATLVASLNRHLSDIAQASSQWPADENQAYREVTRHVLEALYNVPPMTGAGPTGTMGTTGTMGPTGTTTPGLSTQPGMGGQPGATSPSGTTSPSGGAGMGGQTGPTGSTGSTGATGSEGAAGSTGTTGQ